MTPPRRPQGSNDSFPPLTPDQLELILSRLDQAEGRWLNHLASVHQDVQAQGLEIAQQRRDIVELKANALETKRTNDKIDALAADVRAVLLRDASQEERLAVLEQATKAGAIAGMKTGSLVTLLIALLTIIAHLLGVKLPSP